MSIVGSGGEATGSWIRRLGYLLFFTMLFLPTRYQSVKAVALGIVLVAIVGAWFNGRLLLRARPLACVIGVMSIGVLFTLYGVVRNFAGALEVGRVYVAWPLVYLFLVSAITTRQHLNDLLRIIVFATNAIGAYGCAWILSQQGRLPQWISTFALDQSQIYYPAATGMTTASFTTLATLTFLIPFIASLLLFSGVDSYVPVKQRWLYLALILAIALTVLSGRRGLLFVVMATPAIIGVLLLVLRNSGMRARLARPMILLGCAGIVGVLWFGVDIGGLVSRVQAGFDPSSSIDASIRRAEYRQLSDGFSANPLFGQGFGATVELIRDPLHPWAYELSYLSLLYNVGLVGFGIYALSILGPMAVLLRLSSRQPWLKLYAVPVLVGELGFLLANATNPYLAKFDSLWVVFIPIALLNVAASVQQKDGAAVLRSA